MKTVKKWSMLLAASFVLAACGGSLDQGSDTESQVESQSEVINSESSEIIESSEVISSEETSSVESTPEETSESESETQLNEDEAAMIDRAVTTISDLTGYAEEDGYLFMIHPIEGNIVTIEVRENQEETASLMGMYKYNDDTKAVQQMDIVTGEYVDYPAE
ncbi:MULTISPECIES: hypothetical protein [unclassified Jeotgalibaca]|uniref:hypothetical protein n=1 Tax=unclassified Jeotgalibaca TaxID=2621505 RepID=UPI003FD01F49